ncbi:MAG: hypothetical protein FJ285_06160 [Planctomycetes bacterium]|nr:hypothetical protein [Planctomycetota bacterium]
MAVTEERTWSSHPARERPLAACAALATVAAMAFLVSRIAGDWMWGALAAIGLLIAILRFLLPTRCGINARGVVIHQPLSSQRIAWTEIVGIESSADATSITLRCTSARGRSISVPLSGLTTEQHTRLRNEIAAAVEQAIGKSQIPQTMERVK